MTVGVGLLHKYRTGRCVIQINAAGLLLQYHVRCTLDPDIHREQPDHGRAVIHAAMRHVHGLDQGIARVKDPEPFVIVIKGQLAFEDVATSGTG